VVGGGARREDGQELRVVRLKVHAGLLQPQTPKKTKTRATHRDRVQSRDGHRDQQEIEEENRGGGEQEHEELKREKQTNKKKCNTRMSRSQKKKKQKHTGRNHGCGDPR
jgi:hypothetical protein